MSQLDQRWPSPDPHGEHGAAATICQQRVREPQLDLAHGPGVAGELLVACEERDAFDQGLGQQEAVEGIFVQRGQAIDIHRMLAGNGKLGVAVVEQSPAQQTRLDDEVRSSQGLLDGDLPQAGGAEEELVARVVQERAGRRGEPVRLAGRR